MPRPLLLHVAVAAILALCVSAAAQAQDLPLNGVEAGRVAEGATAEYVVNATQSGVLTVAVRSQRFDTDLALFVTNAEGTTIAYGDSDQFGDRGSEQVAVTLPAAGKYTVRVECYSSKERWANYRIGGSFLPFEGIARAIDELDPKALTLNQRQDIEVSGARPQYHAFTAEADGVLTVVTAGIEGDVVLLAYTGGVLGPPAVRSDQDLEGDLGNEVVVLNVRRGETVHVAIEAFGDAEVSMMAQFVANEAARAPGQRDEALSALPPESARGR